MQFVLVLGLIPSTTKYVENTKAHPTTEMSNVSTNCWHHALSHHWSQSSGLKPPTL